MQTGENSIIEARIQLVYIVLLFAVKYKFMTLWLNTTINSSALSLPFESLINFSAFSQWGVGSCFEPRV